MKFEFTIVYTFAEKAPTNNPSYFTYTLLDKKWNKVVFVTDKKFEEFQHGDKVEATIEINIKSERMFPIVNKKPANEAEFVETAKKSLNGLKKVQ